MSAMRHLEPHGVDTLLGEEVEFQESLTALFRDRFRQYGYRPVLTPTFEYLDLFREAESLSGDDMVKLIARDGRIIVLRPDATVPVSRMTARLYKDIRYPLKFSYITSVYRWADPKKGERLEILQAGIEAYNQPEPDCDAEVLAMGIQSLADTGIEELHVDIGHAGWLEGLHKDSGIPEDLWKRVLQAVEMRSPDMIRALLEKAEVQESVIQSVLVVPELFGEVETIIEAAEKWVINDTMAASLRNLRAVYTALKCHNPKAKIHADLGFTNPFRYYTGVIFKGYSPGCGEPLLQGGRYDQLASRFGAEKPACGLGINISLLAEVLEKMKIKEWNPCATDYLVLYEDTNRSEALALSQTLRSRGFVVESECFAGGTQERIASATYRNTREIIEVNADWVRVTNLIKNDVVRLPREQFVISLEPVQLASIH